MGRETVENTKGHHKGHFITNSSGDVIERNQNNKLEIGK